MIILLKLFSGILLYLSLGYFGFPHQAKPIFNLFYGVNGSKMWKQQLSNYPTKYTTLQNLYKLAEKIENSKFDGHKLLA